MRLWNRASKRTALAAAAAVLLTVLPIGEGVAGPDGILDDPTGREVPWAGLPSALGSAPDIEQLLQDLAPEMESRFAGAWFDSSGRIKVAMTTGGLPSALAAHPRVEAVRHRFSLELLDDVIEEVASRLNSLLAEDWESEDSWPFTAWVNQWENIVEVDFDPSQATRREDIDQQLAEFIEGGTVRVLGYDRDQKQNVASFHEEKLPDLDLGNPCLPGDVCAAGLWNPGCGTRTNCSSPFRGGIRGSSDKPCTLGFVMRSPDGVRLYSTAGHCPDSNGSRPWRHGGRRVGVRQWWQNSGAVDFKLIRQDNQDEPAPTNMIYRAGDHGTRISLKISSPGTGLIGNELCQEGALSGQRCGRLTDHNATHTGRTGFGRMEASGCGGDSGAPVVANSTNRAYGVVRGGWGADPDAECGYAVAFTWVPRFESASGRQVLLTPTTEALGSGQRLPVSSTIRSRDGRYYLIMQADGNLVMYRTSGGAVWATGTNGPKRFAVMQNDGNFVVYGQGCSGACWASGTSGSQMRLNIQNDGNLVIYRSWGAPVWDRYKGLL